LNLSFLYLVDLVYHYDDLKLFVAVCLEQT
jgi:hypothetical protein